MNELEMETVRASCSEEAQAIATREAPGLAKDDVERAGLHGEAADSLYQERLEHHYAALKEKFYSELMDGAK